MRRADRQTPDEARVTKKRILLLFFLVSLITAFFVFDLQQYLSLASFKARQDQIDQVYRDSPWLSASVYFTIYVAVTALSLPGAALMTLAGGAIFGLLAGTVIVSFASSIGATLAFLASRFLFQDLVQRRFGQHLGTVNHGIRKDGGFYLFTLRLVPAFPFFAINLLMGLTPIRVRTFYWVSQIGMLAGTLVYINAGTQIAKIESVSGILSPALIGSFLLLGIFPWIARKGIAISSQRQVLRNYPRPKKFDRNLIVIGAGSAGLVSAYIAAAIKAKVTLIEKHRMGGDCLNTGCVPSKALLRSAKFINQVESALEFGIRSAQADFDFAEVMARVRSVIRKIEPHDSVERYKGLGVECIQGEARITSPYTVEVNGKTLSTRNIVIATGASPLVPPIEGLREMDYLTSDTLWDLNELPKRFLVLGGGPIGCELAQAFQRLGSQVTLVEMLSAVLTREDPEVSMLVMERFKREGIDLRLKHRAKRFSRENHRQVLICEGLDGDSGEVRIEFDRVLVALGRVANTRGFGLEELGIGLSKSGTVETNDFLQTIYPNIYACGDVAGPYQFTHTAAHQAWYATVNALFSGLRRFSVDYSVIPWATFCDPEVARVGLNEVEAREKQIPCEVTRFDLEELDRAIADSENHGFVKVLSVPGKDRILGVTIVGNHAGDLIAEYVLAMRHGIGLNKILGTIHIYPTLAEANKYAAGNWKKAHAPARLLEWLQRFHTWRRG
ncbi:MAG: FAD-dependent oxidoreductase [Methylococcales bacterium]